MTFKIIFYGLYLKKKYYIKKFKKIMFNNWVSTLTIFILTYLSEC